MKKFIITAFAAAFVFAGCKTEFDMVEATLGEQTITFVSDSDVETKTTMSITGNAVKYSWTEEDTNFAVFYGETAATSVTPSISGSTLSIKATFAPGTLPTEGTVDFTGYLNGSIKSFQTMDAVNNSYDPSADVMIAKASVSASDLSSPVLFQFKRMVSVAKLTLTGLPSAADKFVISADKPILGSTNAIGEWTSAEGAIEVSGSGDDNVVYFTLAPNAEISLHVTAIVGSDYYVGTSNGTKTFTAGNVRGTTIAMTKASSFFTETFNSNKGTGGNDGKWNGSIASENSVVADQSGWNLQNQGGANACVRLGTSKAAGSATTPSIVANASDAVLSFRAAAWDGSSEGTSLKISAENCTLDRSTVQLVKGKWTMFSIGVSDITGPITVTFSSARATYNRFFLDEVAVYGVENETPMVSAASPSLTPAGSYTTSPYSITITNNEEGATVYYSTDGSTPSSANSESFTGASKEIELTTSATVKAIAVVPGKLNSDVTSSEYIYIETLSTMDQIFAKASAVSSTATDATIVFSNWIVSGVKNNNAYVTDGTKGFIIYSSGHGFEPGDILSGTVACKVQLYKGSSEVTSISSKSSGLTVTKGGTVTPVAMSIKDLSGVNTGAVLTYSGLKYNGESLTDGKYSITPYSTFATLPTLVVGSNYDVVGLFVMYDSTREILPFTTDGITLSETQDVESGTSLITITASDFEGQGISGGKNDGTSSMTKTLSDVTISVSNGYKNSSNSYAQFYSGSTVTISSEMTIKSVTFNSSATNSSNYSAGKLTLSSKSSGSYSAESGSTFGVWTGSAQSIEFNASQQARITSIVVEYTSN